MVVVSEPRPCLILGISAARRHPRPKAPEAWRSPGRWRVGRGRWKVAKRLGVRQSPAAFPRQGVEKGVGGRDAQDNGTTGLSDYPTIGLVKGERGRPRQLIRGFHRDWQVISDKKYWSDGTPMAGQQFEYAFDADGNLVQDGLWSYTWDTENRLVSMQSVSSGPSAARLKLDFAYDHLSRRTQKVVSTWNGSAYVPQSTNRFVYEGWNLVAVLNPNNTPLLSFVWGTDLSGTTQGAGGVGGLLSVTAHSGPDAGTYFYCYDGNGNVMGLINAADGSVAARYEYGPFGELLRATGPVAKVNPFRWSTKYQDDKTDIVWYPARPYSPSLGGWLSRDPIEESGGINLYAFLGNAPSSKVDPFGEDAAVVSAGGYTGHTSFVIINPDGSGTAFHFYAAHHGGGCCGSSGSLLALCCDTVNIWPEPFDNLQGYLQAQQGLHGATRVTAYALGSSVDDQVATTLLNDAAKEDQGIYSLALGIECHSKSWDWFQDYVGGGPQINPIQPQPLPPFWPERWFETPRHRQENPPFPSPPNPTR